MISALSKEVRYIIDKLVDGYTGEYDEKEQEKYTARLKKAIDFDKTIRYLPKKEYDMFEGDFKCIIAYNDDDARIYCLYFTDIPALSEETVSALFGGVITTARHFTTINTQLPYTRTKYMDKEHQYRARISTKETCFVSTRYTEYLYNSLKIRELITYIEQLLLSTVLSKMPSSTRGLLPSGRGYRSINEYVELCIIYHLFAKWHDLPDHLKLLYDKVEPLRLYDSYEDFNKQNMQLYNLMQQLTEK